MAHDLIKSMLIYAPATLLPRLAALGLVLVGAHLLPQAQYGYFSLVIVIGEIAEMTSAGWTRIAMLRLGGENPSGNAATVIQIGRFGAASLLLASGLVAAFVFMLVPEAYLVFLASVFLYILSNSCARYALTILQLQQKKNLYSIFESLRAASYFAASLLGMIYSQDFWLPSILGSLTTLLFGLSALYLGTRRLDRISPSSIDSRSLIAFGFPLIVVSLLSYCITSIDKIIVAALHDKATVGAYAVAFALGRQGFDVVANAINIGGFPRLVNQFTQKGPVAAATIQTKTLTLMMAIAIPGGLALMASRKVLASTLLPPDYETAITIALPLVALGAIALNIKNFIYDNIFHLYKNNFLQVPTLAAGAVASVVVAWIFLPGQPFLGASAMFAAGSVTSLTCSVFLTRRLLSFTPEWGFIALSCVIALVVYVLENFIEAYTMNATLKLGGMFVVGLSGVVVSLATTQLRIFGRQLDNPDATGAGDAVAFCFITPTPEKMTGLSSYTDSLISAYAQTFPNKTIILLTNSSQKNFGNLRTNDKIRVYPIFNRHRLPFKIYIVIAHIASIWTARRLRAKEYISTTPHAAVFPLLRQSIVVHDMYDVDTNFRSRAHVAYTNILLTLYMFFSRNIICVSDSTFADAASAMPQGRSKMHVIKEASKYPPIQEEQALNQVRNGRILCVANIEATKNVGCLLEALRLAERRNIDLHVNWIGRDPNGIVRKWIEQNGPLRNFHAMGAVDDPTLVSQYRKASALIVTSFREGFCLPVLEANACGTPAIVSDIPTLREVAGEAGIFFNPRDPEDCLAKMRSLLGAAGHETALKRRAALENARKYSWIEAAHKLDVLLGNGALHA
jgi:O-antigen/teichoic acid export membrane protein/glycosyltransferase involved in cell wall biosynthesis